MALLAAAFLVLVPRGALGISLYDVVRLSKAGYADQDIIRLIGVTESQFVLDPDTLVKLRHEGVSEKVIQALIEARQPAREFSEEGPLKEEHEPPHPHSPTAGSRSPPTAEPPGQTAVGAFAFFPFQEAGSGHGGAHQHYGLTINEVPVLVLRSEAGLPGIGERARIVAGLLNENVRSEAGGFSPYPAAQRRSGTATPPRPGPSGSWKSPAATSTPTRAGAWARSRPSGSPRTGQHFSTITPGCFSSLALPRSWWSSIWARPSSAFTSK